MYLINKLNKMTSLKILLVFVLIATVVLGGVNISYALEGGSGGSGGSGSGSHSVPRGNPSINNAVGYRIYLANGNIVNKSNNKWGDINSYLFSLSSSSMNSRDTAIYEMFLQKGTSTSSNSYVQEQKNIYNYGGAGKAYPMIDLGGNKKTNTPSFSELFEGTSLQGKLPVLDKWSYSVASSSQQQASLINWTNKAFKGDAGGLSSTEDINKFLENYKKIVTAKGYGGAANKLPKTASDFKNGNWAIVVEPPSPLC